LSLFAVVVMQKNIRDSQIGEKSSEIEFKTTPE
jgi:hypothetical protein